MEFTNEMLEKAKQCKTAEELMALAKENGFEMTEDSATVYLAKLNQSGELADDELDNVAGGGCGSENQSNIGKCPKCGGEGKSLLRKKLGSNLSYDKYYECINCAHTWRI